ncbi:MAG: hypothetical protein JO254_14255 [Pseudolabrys sp.]|nr:hypothetical protein [Pseudolabrys sp.]
MHRFVRNVTSIVFTGLLLAACSQTGGDQTGRSLVAPGGFDFYDCPQLARQEKDLTTKERMYVRLMDKAKQDGASGRVVSAIAYEADYASTVATLREVRKAQKERNCPPAPPSSARGSDAAVR